MQSNFRERMKIKEIVSALERFAPLPLQDGFDNAGLQVGLTEAEATGALLCLDVTEAVVDEAVMLGYQPDYITSSTYYLKVINLLLVGITLNGVF